MPQLHGGLAASAVVAGAADAYLSVSGAGTGAADRSRMMNTLNDGRFDLVEIERQARALRAAAARDMFVAFGTWVKARLHRTGTVARHA